MRHEIPVKSDVLPIPVNETERLKELHSLKLIDSNPEELYDDITRIAAELTGSPSALLHWLMKTGFGLNRGWEAAPLKFNDAIHFVSTP